VLSVATDLASPGTLYAGTDTAGIYESTNCGADWTKVNTGVNGDVLGSGLNWTLFVKADEPNVLFANAFEGENLGLMKSTNRGVDWHSTFAGTEVETYVDYNGYFQASSVDPDNPDHIVVTFHADCLGPYAPYCMGETLDAGETWRLLHVPAEGWIEGAAPFVLGPTSFLLIAGGILYTNDSGANWEVVDLGAAIGGGYRKSDGTHTRSELFGRGARQAQPSHESARAPCRSQGHGLSARSIHRLARDLSYAPASWPTPTNTGPRPSSSPCSSLPSATMNTRRTSRSCSGSSPPSVSR